MADNCEPRKVDSNSVGLSFAETICGVLPTIEADGYLPTWYELEPNEFPDFGGEISTTARKPINASRQNKKGVTTDLDATGGFNTDYTQNNLTRLLQGFFFADIHEKATTKPMNGTAITLTGAVAADDTFTAAAGLGIFRVGQLVKVSGFLTAANNGLKRVTSVTGVAIGVDTPLTDEAGSSDVVIEAVGYQMVNGGTAMALQGALGVLTLGTNPVEAAGTILFDNAATDGDTVTVGGVVYTFRAVADAPFEVPFGANANASASNLASAVRGELVLTEANPRVTASAATATVTVTALIAGTSGNGITLATNDATDINVSGATLTGGTGFSFKELGLVVGEWFYCGGDTAAEHFINAGVTENTGYARAAVITDQTILMDKTTFVPVANAGATRDIRLFVGNTLVNEKDPDLIITRYYELERTLGRDTDGVQSEYLTRAVANELTLNLPVADKVVADLAYIGGDAEQRTGAEGRKPGPFVAALGEDAFNTTSHVVRARMAVLDPATSRPTPLFAYVTDVTLSIDNGVTPIKAIANLGAIDVSVGTFDVTGEVTAIFSTVLATRAVRNNADVTFDVIMAARNAGSVWDIPLLSLGNGKIEVEAGEPVTIPLDLMGAENQNNYTLLYTSFPYLPTVAMPVANTVY